MSDLIYDSFTQFYTSIAASYQILNESRTRIEDRKGTMLKLLEKGLQIPEPPSEAGEYQQLCRDMMNGAKLQVHCWQELIRQQLQRSEFVNRHEKSILALVFADVNAGKSSLGNFVGGWNLQDTPYASLYQPHQCEIEDFSKASQENRQERIIDHFAENATEATSTIQHYTLAQGLTWVDTPGLHSLTKEHGDLAKEYIQFADLVVYLTSSSSPFKSDERDMLGDLFRMGKPVILAITKSDFTHKKVVDGKIVYTQLPKAAANRTAQESFVSTQVREIIGNDNLENSHILSLSVRLAKDAVKTQDSALFAASNLDKFFSQMGAVLSEKAVELKMRRPKAEVNAFIDRLIGQPGKTEDGFLTITQLREELAEKIKNLNTVITECEKEKSALCAEVDRQLPTNLSLQFRSLRDRDLIGDPKAVQNEMSETVSKLVAEVCKKRLKSKLGALPISVTLPPLQVKNADGSGYEYQYIEQVITRSEERAPEGIFENIVHFVDRDKKFYRTVNHKEFIKSGDNFKSFLDAQVESVRPEVREHVAGTIQHMTSACISPLLACYQKLDEQLETLTAQLERLRFNK